MTEFVLDPQPPIALQIGTGSGYQAAILLDRSKMCIRSRPSSLWANGPRRARANWVEVRNVHPKSVFCWRSAGPDAAPDKIIVTCSSGNRAAALIDQLKEATIVPARLERRTGVHMFEKQKGELVKTRLVPALFVP